MSRCARAWKRLVYLYDLVLRSNGMANAERFAFPSRLHRASAGALVEQLEPRLMLSGNDLLTDLGVLGNTLLSGDDGSGVVLPLGTGFSGLSEPVGMCIGGRTGDVAAIDLTELAPSDQYRLIGAQLVEEGRTIACCEAGP